MPIKIKSFIRFTLLLLPVIVLILAVSIANGQSIAGAPAPQKEEVATVVHSSPSEAATSNVPVFTEYRGLTIGMPAAEVRAKFDRLKKGNAQDFLAFSEEESAQIFYDDDGKVIAISVDYFGENSKPPQPDVVLGVGLEAKPDGSMYQLNRYPEAGYWVSYNRTSGDKPIVTITMQKI